MPALEQFTFSSRPLLDTELNPCTCIEQAEEYGVAFGEWGNCHHELVQISKDEGSKDRAKIEAVARYQKEMLELLKDAPEYVYELSLRDLVELPKIVEHEKLKRSKSGGGKQKGKKGRKRNPRSSSFESGGFLLKMFLPLPLQGKKKKRIRSPSGSLKSDSGSSKSGSSSRGSPKHLLNGGHSSSNETLEEQCPENQQNGALSKNLRRRDTACYPFFIHMKTKSKS